LSIEFIEPRPMASQAKLDIRPTAAEAHSVFEQTSSAPQKPTLLPVCITVPSDLLTPSATYLKLSNGYAMLHLTADGQLD
jgi:anthranilate synthase component 1